LADFAIVDTHVHLYDSRVLSYPWKEQAPALDRPYLADDFRPLTAGVDVEPIVFVEVDAAPGDHLAEARFAQEQAEAEPGLRGMVASMPLEMGAAVEPELVEDAKLPFARGVRRLIERHHHEPGWTLGENFLTGVRPLAKFRFTFDLCLFHPQLGEMNELARRCPEVNFVVDHIAKPRIRQGLRESWWRELRATGPPNVWRKNFRRSPIVDTIVAGASNGEKRRLYRDNAIAFYRLWWEPESHGSLPEERN
jgi:L-fuconolactonase